ncbi:MAG TPA: penicillin-insensitive murein endopeptidase [Bryobacteraceae bacterium]|nr:penicillin-insensitive murein endopeptidase [Bryobacteraceae bacterium]
MQRNRIWAQRLGWLHSRRQIADLLRLPPGKVHPEAFVSALKRWQQSRGIHPSGVLGPSTWHRMRSEGAGRSPGVDRETGAECQCPKCQSAGTETEEEIWDTVKDVFGKVWPFGSSTTSACGAVPGSKEYNQWVQRALSKALATKLGTDGVLGTKSKAAIRDFQTKKGLPVTGNVDAATDKALRAAGAGAPPIAGRKTGGSPQPLAADFRKQRPAYYKWVQESLNKILGLSLVTDGAVGSATKAAIRDFQKKVGISVTGAVDCNTEGKLIENNGCRMPHPLVDTQLPVSGPGYYSYKTTLRHKQFGLSETIAALKDIGSRWAAAHPSGPRYGIGEISLQGGGCISGHASHQMGIDVDLAVMRKDGKGGHSNYRDKSTYSQSLTQELVNLIRTNKVLPVQMILFNDPAVTGVKKWPNHDNHLHVRFRLPARAGG